MKADSEEKAGIDGLPQSELNTLARAFRQIGALTAISRLFGFVRDLIFAHILGAGPALDAFLVAFKLPNFFRCMTADGAMTNAFLPAFSHLRKSQGQKAALLLAAEVQIILLLVLCFIVLIAEIFMPVVIGLLAPGFIDIPMRFEAAVTLARITIPYLPIISIVALWAGITNAHDRFFAGAASPILLNFGLIGGTLCVPLFRDDKLDLLAQNPLLLALPVAVAVLLAGVCQMLLMQNALGRLSARPALVRPRISPEGRKMWRAFLPAALGAGSLQINLLVDTVLASFLVSGSISWLYYGDRVAQLPLGIIGIALGTALLPRLSRLEAENRHADIALELSKAMKIAAFFSLPCAAATLVIAGPIITGLFGGGAFLSSDITAAAGALAAYGLGIPAYVFTKVLQPAFFAAGKAGTMLKISLGAVVINLLASLYFMQFFAHVGLALATSLAAYCVLFVQCWLLFRDKKIDIHILRRIGRPLMASAVMAIMLAIFNWLKLVPTNWPASNVLELMLLVFVGMTCYCLLSWWLGILPKELLGMKAKSNKGDEYDK